MLVTIIVVALIAVLLSVLSMADVATNTAQNVEPRSGLRTFVVKNAAVIKAGALVGTDAAGFLDHWSDTAGHKFCGLLLKGCTGDTAATPPVEGLVDCSGSTLRSNAIAGTFVQADLNGFVYCATDNPADAKKAADTNVKAIGWASRFVSAGVGNITLFTPEEHLGLN